MTVDLWGPKQKICSDHRAALLYLQSATINFSSSIHQKASMTDHREIWKSEI
jgi:hypothetical protein